MVERDLMWWVAAAPALLIAGGIAIIILEVRQARRRDPRRRQCPACGGTHVRPSYPGGFRDGLYRLFGLAPYRCRACSVRFYRPEPHRLAGEAESN